MAIILHEGLTIVPAEQNLADFPRDVLLLDIAAQLDWRYRQSVVDEYARAQCAGISEVLSQQRNPNAADGCPKQPRPTNSLLLGMEYATCAQAAVVYGLMYDSPGVLQASTMYFGLAHANLFEAEDYQTCAYNARRAAETAAFLGDTAAFAEWADMAEWTPEEVGVVVQSYEAARESWQARMEHETLLEGNERSETRYILKQWALIIGSVLNHVEIYANQQNGVPPHVAASAARIRFLEERHAASQTERGRPA